MGSISDLDDDECEATTTTISQPNQATLIINHEFEVNEYSDSFQPFNQRHNIQSNDSDYGTNSLDTNTTDTTCYNLPLIHNFHVSSIDYD